LAVLPSAFETESAPGNSDFVARWLACALPYRRFVDVLANANARLGADADRYSFIVSDFHRLLPAGLPAQFESDMLSHAVGLAVPKCKFGRAAPSGPFNPLRIDKIQPVGPVRQRSALQQVSKSIVTALSKSPHALEANQLFSAFAAGRARVLPSMRTSDQRCSKK
jgi:hypothetical protein